MVQDNFYKSKSIIADRVKLMVKKKELKEVFFKINESKEKITLNDLHISLKKKDYIREFLKNLESADLIQYIIDKRKKFWIPTKKGKELYEALKSGDQIAIFQYCF